MAGSFDALFTSTFTNQTTFTVVHSLDRIQVAVIVRIGDVARNDLVTSIAPNPSDPRNGIVVTLNSQQSGSVILLDTDYIFANIPTPENAAILSGGDALTTGAGEIAALTSKGSPVGADLLLIEDSADSNNKKRVTVSSLPGGGGGEANTASNVGTAGVGVFKQKTGTDLEFKKINARSNKVIVVDDTGNDEVDIDVEEVNITHQNLGGAGTNTHAQIDTHIASTANPHSTSIANIGSGTLAQLNSAVSDATLDDAASSRPPSGSAGGDLAGTYPSPEVAAITALEAGSADDVIKNDGAGGWTVGAPPGGAPSGSAGGDLGGTYPNPTVNNGADGTAIHDDTGGEISAITEKAAPVGADLILIEDSADSNNKKRVQLSNLPTSVFGSDYQTAISTALDTTTSTAFQTKVTLTTPSLTGTYRIGWTALISQSNNQDKVEARLRNVTDGVTVGVPDEGARIEPKDPSNRQSVGSFAEVVFSGASKSFEIQWRQQDGSIASIQDARIELWRVA